MLLYILAYVGGVLTILSPCILPVLPFVFARADRPFLTNGLPMLIGMALMFMIVASLAAVGGGWAVQANQYGRAIALALLAVFGLTLLLPGFAERLMRPLVALGSRLSGQADAQGSGLGPSLLLGIATGLLWAPCAGPILGLVLTGAALQGASAGTSLLLLAYALGSATSLALALVVGGRLFKAMKRSLGVGEWVRRALGAVVLIAVAAIATGLDTGFLTRASLAGTNRVEQGLLDRVLGPRSPDQDDADLADEGAMPPLEGAVAWLNSPPLTREELKGKVVLVDFWTYSCINCLRALPYVKASGRGVAAAAGTDIRSPETYIGYGRSERWASRPAVSPDRLARYSVAPKSLNEWGLTGAWTVGAEAAVAAEPGARILYRFHARDLHLVLGPGGRGRPVRFRVTIDGHPPGEAHGVDTDAGGNGVVTEERLYQLIRQRGPVHDRVFEIEFLDPGVQAFSFTFG